MWSKNKYLPLFSSSGRKTDGVGARRITVPIVKVSITLREVVASVTWSTVFIIAEGYIGSGGETIGSRSINTNTVTGSRLTKSMWYRSFPSRCCILVEERLSRDTLEISVYEHQHSPQKSQRTHKVIERHCRVTFSRCDTAFCHCYLRNTAGNSLEEVWQIRIGSCLLCQSIKYTVRTQTSALSSEFSHFTA